MRLRGADGVQQENAVHALEYGAHRPSIEQVADHGLSPCGEAPACTAREHPDLHPARQQFAHDLRTCRSRPADHKDSP